MTAPKIIRVEQDEGFAIDPRTFTPFHAHRYQGDR